MFLPKWLRGKIAKNHEKENRVRALAGGPAVSSHLRLRKSKLHPSSRPRRRK